MRTFIGIDLGSTTTKAVVLDENQQVIGRGITNSRSNYGTAARVASEEARVDGRFTLFRRTLSGLDGDATHVDDFLGALERSFRLEQFLEQLADLEETCLGQLQDRAFRQGRREMRRRRCRRSSRVCAPRRRSSSRRAPNASPTFSATSPDRASTSTPKRSLDEAGVAA